MRDGLSLKYEIGRKMVHLSSVIIILIYFYFGKSVSLLVLTVLLIFFIEIEYFRIEWGRKLPYFWRFVRLREEGQMGGEVFFIIGALIAISVFSFSVAAAAILMTTFGDMAAAIVGKSIGKHRVGYRSKTWEGSAAEFIVNLAIGSIFIQNYLVVMVMALTATVVETLVTRMDDNLLIPLFAGFNGHLVLILLGG